MANCVSVLTKMLPLFNLTISCHGRQAWKTSQCAQRSYSYAKIFVSRDSDRVARDEPHLAHQAAGVLERWLLTLLDAAVFVHFAIVIPALHSRLSDRNQIWHTCSDGYGTDSNLNKFDPPDPRGVPGGILRGQKFKSPGNVMNCPENQFFF